jgi:hypothetical protein
MALLGIIYFNIPLADVCLVSWPALFGKGCSPTAIVCFHIIVLSTRSFASSLTMNMPRET